MGKVTSKLQVTVPKAIAEQYRIRPGDEIVWVPAGDTIRVQPRKSAIAERSVTASLRMFDDATKRQKKRNEGMATATGARGWSREDLYGRGRPR
jgi:AbrB family looped-hinge helix DNA binding protein